MVKVGDLNTEDPVSNPRLGLLNEFVLGDPKGNFTIRFVNSQLVCLLPVGILTWERGDLKITMKGFFRGVIIRYL